LVTGKNHLETHFILLQTKVENPKFSIGFSSNIPGPRSGILRLRSVQALHPSSGSPGLLIPQTCATRYSPT
jgi:hypothetical protein